jgi:chorismate synthase
MFRYLTAGESHGPGLVAIVEGVPAGLGFATVDLANELRRRRLGHGRGRRMQVEMDRFEVIGGVRFGETIGGPIAVLIHNSEWEKWREEMSAEPGESRRPLTTPRPGHADLAGMLKYDRGDARDVLERASARETAARTVAGYIAKALLAEMGVTIVSHVVQIGDVRAEGEAPRPSDLPDVDRSPVRCFSPEVGTRMVAAIDAAKEARDTLGGVIEVIAYGVPVGLGSHVHADRKLDGLLAGAVMSIPAIKGVEIGDGFAGAAKPGSAAHDEIGYEQGEFVRTSNRAGGTEGGISTGEPIVVRAAMKPISTLMRPLETIDVVTKNPKQAFRERSDVCAVPAAGVIAEQMAAIVLAREALRKFGGDTVGDFVGAVGAYRRRLSGF